MQRAWRYFLQCYKASLYESGCAVCVRVRNSLYSIYEVVNLAMIHGDFMRQAKIHESLFCTMRPALTQTKVEIRKSCPIEQSEVSHTQRFARILHFCATQYDKLHGYMSLWASMLSFTHKIPKSQSRPKLRTQSKWRQVYKSIGYAQVAKQIDTTQIDATGQIHTTQQLHTLRSMQCPQ